MGDLLLAFDAARLIFIKGYALKRLVMMCRCLS